MPRFLTAFIISALVFASPALAEFIASSDNLYEDWPMMEQDTMSGGEFQIHAIAVEGSSDYVIYVLSRYYRDKLVPFGAFECGVEFTLLDSFTNGFRDIRCVTKTNGVGATATYILRVSNNAGYEYGY